MIDEDLFPMTYGAFARMKWDGLRDLPYPFRILVTAEVRRYGSRDKMVDLHFGFPGCMCDINHVAIFDDEMDESTVIERMLSDCELYLSIRPHCPVCGCGLEGDLEEFEDEIPYAKREVKRNGYLHYFREWPEVGSSVRS